MNDAAGRRYQRHEQKRTAEHVAEAALRKKGLNKLQNESESQWEERMFRHAQADKCDFIPALEGETCAAYAKRFSHYGEASVGSPPFPHLLTSQTPM